MYIIHNNYIRLLDFVVILKNIDTNIIYYIASNIKT